MAEVKIPAKRGEKVLMLKNTGLSGLILIKIGYEEILVAGPSLIPAIGVIQTDQQFTSLDGMKVA